MNAAGIELGSGTLSPLRCECDIKSSGVICDHDLALISYGFLSPNRGLIIEVESGSTAMQSRVRLLRPRPLGASRGGCDEQGGKLGRQTLAPGKAVLHDASSSVCSLASAGTGRVLSATSAAGNLSQTGYGDLGRTGVGNLA